MTMKVRAPSAETACTRLKRVQSLLARSGLDALLLIAGVDSRQHTGSHQALGYLLMEHSGQGILEDTRLPEAFNEVILVIKPDSVGIYSPPEAHAQLQAILGPLVPNTMLLVPGAPEVQSADLLEQFKIGALVALLHGCERIGMPLTTSISAAGNVMAANPMQIEKWPLIQAYGLDGVGQPGFFTQNMQVSDVTPDLTAIYCQLDAVGVQHVVSQSSMLSRHWQEMMGMINNAPAQQREHLTEQDIAEPLLTYCATSTATTTKTTATTSNNAFNPTPTTRVVFGPNTTAPTQQSSNSAALGTVKHPSGAVSLHMVAEAVDPSTYLTCARTYFLSHGAALSRALLEGGDGLLREDERVQLLEELGKIPGVAVAVLLFLYRALVHSHRAAMARFSEQKKATVDSCKSAAVAAFRLHLADAPPTFGTQDLTEEWVDIAASSYTCAMWQVDHSGVAEAAVRGTRKVKVLRSSLGDISQLVQGHSGSLVFADTYLEVLDSDGDICQLLNLTSDMPAAACFAVHSSEASNAASVLRAITAAEIGERPSERASTGTGLTAAAHPLGRQIGDSAPDAPVLSADALLPCVRGQLTFFERGFTFVSPTCGPVTVSFDRCALTRVVLLTCTAPLNNSNTSGGVTPTIASPGTTPGKASISGPLLGISGPLLGISGSVLVLEGCVSEAASAQWPTPGTSSRTFAIPMAPLPAVVQRGLTREVWPAWHRWCSSAGVPFTTVDGQLEAYLGDSCGDSYRAACQPMPRVWPLACPDACVSSALRCAAETDRRGLFSPLALQLQATFNASFSARFKASSKAGFEASFVQPVGLATGAKPVGLATGVGAASGTAVTLTPPVEVTLLTGPPGCGQARVCSTLTEFSANRFAWEIVDCVALAACLPTEQNQDTTTAAAAAIPTELLKSSKPAVARAHDNVIDIINAEQATDNAAAIPAEPLKSSSNPLNSNTLKSDSLKSNSAVSRARAAINAALLAAADAATRAATLSNRHPRIALIAPSCSQLPLQLATLLASPAFTSQRCALAGSLVCVAADTFFECNEQPQPHVLDQVPPGLCTAVVLSSSSAGPARKVKAVLQARGALVVVGADTQTLVGAMEQVVIGAREYGVCVEAQARQWMQMTGHGSEPPRFVRGRVEVVHAAFTGTVSLTKLKTQLMAHGMLDTPETQGQAASEVLPLSYNSPDGGDGILPRVHAVMGVLELTDHKLCEDGPRVCRVEGLRGASIEVSAAPKQFGSVEGSQLVVVGTGLQASLVQAWLLEAQAEGPQLKALRRRDGLMLTEIAQVQLLHQHDPVPPGWVYTGSEFCDPFGEVKFTHPNHEDHLQAYLALENQAVKELNAAAMESLAAIKPIQITSMEWGRLP